MDDIQISVLSLLFVALNGYSLVSPTHEQIVANFGDSSHCLGLLNQFGRTRIFLTLQQTTHLNRLLRIMQSIYAHRIEKAYLQYRSRFSAAIVLQRWWRRCLRRLSSTNINIAFSTSHIRPSSDDPFEMCTPVAISPKSLQALPANNSITPLTRFFGAKFEKSNIDLQFATSELTTSKQDKLNAFSNIDGQKMRLSSKENLPTFGVGRIKDNERVSSSGFSQNQYPYQYHPEQSTRLFQEDFDKKCFDHHTHTQLLVTAVSPLASIDFLPADEHENKTPIVATVSQEIAPVHLALRRSHFVSRRWIPNLGQHKSIPIQHSSENRLDAKKSSSVNLLFPYLRRPAGEIIALPLRGLNDSGHLI